MDISMCLKLVRWIGAKQMLEFDPNKKKQGDKPRIWAAYVPGRHPEFKTYTQRNYASSALSYHHVGILYKLVNDDWVEEDRCERPTKCGHCDKAFVKGRYGYSSRHELYHHPAKPAYKRPWVCDECYNRHFCYGASDPIPAEHCGLVQMEY